MPYRKNFDDELADLKQDILRMASLVEQSIYKAMEALFRQDPLKARDVITGDDEIDRLFYEVENKCIRLIATQQPLARDLRVIVTGIKILIDLERMGDHAVDIARAAMCVCGHMPEKAMAGIQQMAYTVQHMVKDGLDAYVHADVDKARQMGAMDDKMDDYFNLTFQSLVQYMEENPESISYVAYLILVARHLERLADRATNIGEDVIYLVTGEWQDLN